MYLLQYFSKEFTKNHLLGKIKASGCDVTVHYLKNQQAATVRMKIAKGTKTCIMTKGWTSVLNATNFVATNVVMFSFQEEEVAGAEGPERRMHVYVDKIVPGAFGM